MTTELSLAVIGLCITLTAALLGGMAWLVWRETRS
jgi:hypothetical protein